MIDTHQQYLQNLWHTVGMRPLSRRAQAAGILMDRIVAHRGGGDPYPREAGKEAPPMGAPQAGDFSVHISHTLARAVHEQA